MQFDQLKRRDFIALLGGAAAWPLAAKAQHEGVRRIGLLFPLPPGPLWQRRLAEFTKELRRLGWTDGRNIQLETRWSAGDPADTRRSAAELVAHEPEVVLVTGGVGMGAMLQTSQALPVVFVIVPDPVGSGFVASLARPGGNATGFMMFEYNIVGKWVQTLKQIAPHMTRAAILWDPTTIVGVGQFAVIQSVAPSFGVDVSPITLSNNAEIASAVSAFAREPNGGLILTASAKSAVHHNLIIELAARHKLPAIYNERSNVEAGGLISYGPNFLDQYRQAAVYIDRILKGEKPADMPVQAPTKYELVINLKTAKELGLSVPSTLLAQADEVIE
jgi:putative ABC transport system substrate-binding protein